MTLTSIVNSAIDGILSQINLGLPDGKQNGNFFTMKTTIDHAGRLVIPKDIRRESGIKPGMPLEVRWEKGAIAIRRLLYR